MGAMDHVVAFEEAFLSRQYDLYQMLQLQFYVLLMMGAMDHVVAFEEAFLSRQYDLYQRL